MRRNLFLFVFVCQYFGDFVGGFDDDDSIRIVQLLNQLCSDSQGDDTLAKDACYGCFFRASNQPFGYSMLNSISDCADSYLDDQNYGHCQTYLQNATKNTAAGSPARIYCTFLECIRQVNKNTLIRDCINEAIKVCSISISVNEVQRLSQLFVNTTACILAKTRCGGLNPITGAYQENSNSDNTSNKYTIPSINAILVNTNYDINIVQLPFGNGIIDECAKYRNIEQATWPSVQC